MLTARIPIGRLFGIRISVHVSWFIILGLVAYASTVDLHLRNPSLDTAPLIGLGLATALLFFSSLIAHELGHAVLARRLGVPVRGITLFLLGGVAEITREVRVARDEFAIALVGPTVSVFLAGGYAVLSVALGDSAFGGVLGTLAVANGFVAAFNLVPGLPLDGGRLLRAGVWSLTNNFRTATRISATAGRVLALALGITGAVSVVRGTFVGFWYMMLALFLDEAARRAGRQPTPDSEAPEGEDR